MVIVRYSLFTDSKSMVKGMTLEGRDRDIDFTTASIVFKIMFK